MRGLSLVAASGGHSSSRCADLSLSRPVLLRSTGSRCAGSVVVAHGAQPLCGMWDLPRPGLEPVSPALAGGFSTTAPPGKPLLGFYENINLICFSCILYTHKHIYTYTHMSMVTKLCVYISTHKYMHKRITHMFNIIL